MSTAKRRSSCWGSQALAHMGKDPATNWNSIGEIPTAQPALGDRNPIQSSTVCMADEERRSTMRMYPREFPQSRSEIPKRRAERQVFEALAESKSRGFAYYEWRRGYSRIELDFAVWIEGLGRFALQVKGGRYALTDGDWYLKTREGPRLITSCPLDESKLAALDLHDDTEEKAETTYNPFVVPVLVFPDMEPDPHIESLASRKGVYLIWRTDALCGMPVGDCTEPGCARSAISGADRPGGLRGYRRTHSPEHGRRPSYLHPRGGHGVGVITLQ